MSAPGKTLLVTVGSTQFPDLSDAALSEPTLAGLRAAGVTSLIVQLGFAPIPAHIAAVVGREGGRGEVGGLQLNVMRYTGSPGEMDALMRSADGVVSHAGGFFSRHADARLRVHPRRAAHVAPAARRAER